MISNVFCDIKLLTQTAQIPKYADEFAIGADLYADEFTSIEPGRRKLISTGISIAPKSFGYIRVAPRSGLSLRGIDVAAGVVDISFRGEYKVVLVNNSQAVFDVQRGDRIAQLIFEHASQMVFEQKDELSTTQRGEGGFGSSGK